MKKISHIIYISVILVLILFVSFGSDNSSANKNINKIKGKVVSADDLSQSIGGVHLSVDEENEVVSNSKGEFLIEGLKPGFHKINLSKAGYQDKTVSVFVGEKDITRSVIFLDEKSVHFVKR